MASSTSFTSILENIGRINYDDTAVIKTMSTKAIFNLSKILVFFTPLIFVSNTNELFEFPKMYFVYGLGSTIIWFFLLMRIVRWKQIELPNIYVVLFLIANIVSTIFSTHRYTSVWGYYTRFNGSLISIIIFVGLYIVITNELSNNHIKQLIKISCVSLIPIGIYAVFQHYEVIANIWKGNAEVRAFSTFGQPNWLAAFVTMLIPIVLWYVFNSSNNKDRAGWAALYILSFATLWFSYSISGILGLITGTLAFIALNKKEIAGKIGALLSIFAISLLIAISNPGIFKERVFDVYNDLHKLIKDSISVSAQKNVQLSDPGFIRGGLWKGTFTLTLSSPKNIVVGTGPETFPYEFQPYRPPELNYSSEWDFVFNKPHNYYLELLSNLGLLGLGTYLALCTKNVLSKNKMLVPGLIAFFTTNIFGWPTVSTAMLFWLFIAGIEKQK